MSVLLNGAERILRNCWSRTSRLPYAASGYGTNLGNAWNLSRSADIGKTG